MIRCMSNDDGATATFARSTPTEKQTSSTPLVLRGADGSTHALVGSGVIGSSAAVDIVIDDETISRLHAEFEERPDGVWLRDLGSKNGTTVNGLAIGAVRLSEGANVRCGGVSLEVARDSRARDNEQWSSDRFEQMVGRSSAMRSMFARLARAAATDLTVHIRGETGTGKELVARSLHDASPRKKRPFVVVDCASLSASLLESELFGHARGAFTGASSEREGAFEAADGGTIFLDEIGELPLAMQPKLLRVLEDRTVRRVGSNKVEPINVRVISATHRDLRAMVNDGTFREDLYFRLAVAQVVVPPLRERTEDLPLLVAKFLPTGATLPDAVLAELAHRRWSGNVRELKNWVEVTFALGPEALREASRGESATLSSDRDDGSTEAPPIDPRAPYRDQRQLWWDWIERRYLLALLDLHRGNVRAAAQSAEIDRTHLYRMMRKHQL